MATVATTSIQAPSGFTYNGKHTSTMKLIYVPGPEDRGDFYSDYKVISQERSWYPGGEYFHSRVGSREFTLSCFYDMITRAEREAILRWFDRRTSGNLVFDERPYVSYFVRPTKVSKFKDYKETMDGYYSGTFTVTLTAFDPYGTLEATNLAGVPDWADAIKAETYMPYRRSDATDTYTTSSIAFWIYNPGTEVSDTKVRIRCNTGSQPLTITNVTTGQKFTLKAGLTMESGEYYSAYSETGRLIHEKPDGGEQLDFSFHDDGFLKLAPMMPIAEGIDVSISGTTLTTSTAGFEFNESFVNTTIPYYPDDPATQSTKWPRVTRFVSATELEIDWPEHASTTTTLSNVAFIPLNSFTITKAEDATIGYIRITEIPKMR